MIFFDRLHVGSLQQNVEIVCSPHYSVILQLQCSTTRDELGLTRVHSVLLCIHASPLLGSGIFGLTRSSIPHESYKLSCTDSLEKTISNLPFTFLLVHHYHHARLQVHHQRRQGFRRSSLCVHCIADLGLDRPQNPAQIDRFPALHGEGGRSRWRQRAHL